MGEYTHYDYQLSRVINPNCPESFVIQRAKGNKLHDENLSHSLLEQVLTSSVIKVSSHILLQPPIPFRQIKNPAFTDTPGGCD